MVGRCCVGAAMRRLVAFALVVFAATLAVPGTALAVTRDQAVAWALDREGEYLDYDGAYGAQCVDLIKYYYDIFGVAEYARGNGADYASNALPPGWTRIENYAEFVPEPGDIAVWGTALSSAGHVAIILDADLHNFVSMDQNWPKGSPCTQVDHTYSKFWGVVRPAFDAPPPADPRLPDYNYGADGHTLLEGDGEYVVASALDPRYVLDVYGGSLEHGANIQLYGANGTAAQRWRFTANGDGTYTITSVRSGCALDVDDASMQNGANVKQWPHNGGDAQRWWIEDCGDGTFALKAVHSRGFLDVANGVAADRINVQQWQGNGTDAQRWLISRRAGDLATLPGGDGEYVVTSALDPRYALDVCGGSVDDGANIQIYGANGTAAQRWRFTANGDGSYSISSAKSGRLLDVDGRSRADGANVQLWGTEWALNRSWWLEDCGDGTYCIRNVNSGRCLDVRDGAAADGTNVWQWRSNGTAAQRWALLPADTVAPAISDVRVTDVTSEGYTVSCTVTDDVGVERVTFPTWTVTNGQDDILSGYEYDDGYLGTRDGDTWSFRVRASDHGGETGEYVTHVYAWDSAGNVSSVGQREKI